MNHFLFSYDGNKYLETKKYLSSFIEKNINDYDIIVEPFCGIFGFSRYAYEKGFKGQFYLNDINANLIKEYKLMQDDLPTYLDTITADVDKYTSDREMSDDKNKAYHLNLVARTLRAGLCSIDSAHRKIKNFSLKKDTYIQFFNNATFFNLDYLDFIESLPKDKKILIYLDPPYFQSNNKTYDNAKREDDGYCDGTTMYIKLYELLKSSSHDILFIMNKIDLINYIYKDFIKKEYKGTYNNSGAKKGKSPKHHIVYANFPI